MLIFNVLLKELKAVIGVIMLHTLKNIRNTFLNVLLIKLFVLIINLVNQLFFTDEEMQFIKAINSLKQFLKSITIAKKDNKAI